MGDLSRSERRIVAKAIKDAYAKGFAAAEAKFDQMLARFHRLKELNGTGEVFGKAWSEDKHPRDHGKFSSKPGAKGGKKIPTRGHVANWRALAEHSRKRGESHHAEIPGLLQQIREQWPQASGLLDEIAERHGKGHDTTYEASLLLQGVLGRGMDDPLSVAVGKLYGAAHGRVSGPKEAAEYEAKADRAERLIHAAEHPEESQQRRDARAARESARDAAREKKRGNRRAELAEAKRHRATLERLSADALDRIPNDDPAAADLRNSLHWVKTRMGIRTGGADAVREVQSAAIRVLSKFRGVEGREDLVDTAKIAAEAATKLLAKNVLKAVWEESVHSRNHGQFASAPGATGTDSPTTESDPGNTNSSPEHPADADPHHALAEAMLAHAEEAMAAGQDHLPGIDSLRALLDDPAEMGRVLSEGGADDETVGKAVWFVLKAFHPDQPRDDHGRWVSKDALAEAKTDPKKAEQLKKRVTNPEQRAKLDKVLDGKSDIARSAKGQAKHEAGQRRATRDEAKAKTQKILGHLQRVGDLKAKLSADDLYDLADHLGSDHVTVDDVRSMRRALAGAGAGKASFGGANKKDAMVAALVKHARGKGFDERVKEQGLDAGEMRGALEQGVGDAASSSQGSEGGLGHNEGGTRESGSSVGVGVHDEGGRGSGGEATGAGTEQQEMSVTRDAGGRPDTVSPERLPNGRTQVTGRPPAPASAVAAEPPPPPADATPAGPEDVVRYAKELRNGTHPIATVRGLTDHLAKLSDAEVRAVSQALGYTPLDRSKKKVIENLVRNLEGIQMSRQRAHQITTGESHKPHDPPPRPPQPADAAPAPSEVAAPAAPEPAPPAKPGRRAFRPGASGATVEYVRAPAGGQVSEVDGKHYAGGQLMPVHGKYSGQQKPPKGKGVGTAEPVQAKEDGAGGGGGGGRGPQLSPEERRAKAEAQQKWDEMNAGPLGKLTWLGNAPNSKAFEKPWTKLREWREFAESVGPEGVNRIIAALEPEFHGAVESSFRAIRDEHDRKKAAGEWNPAYHREVDADAEDWEKNQAKARAGEAVGMMRGGKGHEKKVPGSHYARELVNEMMRGDNNSGRSMIDAYHRLNQILSGKPPQTPAGPGVAAPTPPQNSPTQVDTPTGVGNNTPTPATVTGGNEGGGKVDTTQPKKITKYSSSRDVDAYRVGNTFRLGDGVYVVAGYARRADDQGGYEHTLRLRPASIDEEKSHRIGELRARLRAMGPGPDDERSRPAHDAEVARLDDEIRALEGRPSRAEEAAASAATAAAQMENDLAGIADLTSGAANLDRIRSRIATQLWIRHKISMSPNDLKKLSADEIRSLVANGRADAPKL